MGRKSSRKRKRRLWRSLDEALAAADTARNLPDSSGYWAPAGDKVSTRLDHVARPLLDDLPADAGVEEKGVVYQLAAMAWNWDVTDETALAISNVIAERLGPDVQVLVEALLDRKRSLFPDDDRVIADLSIREGADDSVYLEVICAQ